MRTLFKAMRLACRVDRLKEDIGVDVTGANARLGLARRRLLALRRAAGE